jgi:hypothetical protein
MAGSAILDRASGPLLVGGTVAFVGAVELVQARSPMLAALAALVVVAGPLVAVVLARPQLGVLVVVAVAPFEGLLEILPLPSVASYAVEGLVLLIAGASLVARPEQRAAPGTPRPPWLLPFVLFLAVGLASGVVLHTGQGLFGLKTTYFYALLGFAVWRCPLTARDRDRLVSILMLDGVVCAAYGLLQQVLGASRLAAMGYEYNTTIRFAGGFLRSFSTFVQPFGFGLFEALVIVVCLPVALHDPKRGRNRLFLLALPLLGLGLLSSIVRAAWLGAALGAVVTLRARRAIVVLLVPVALAAVVLIPPDAVRAAASTSSTNERTQGWRENIAAVVEHPFGLGIGATGSAAITAADRGLDTATSYQPDNWYMKTLLELGSLGLWFWILFLAAVVGTTLRASRAAAGADAALALGVTGMVALAIAASVMATYFEIFPLDLLFWVLVPMASNAGRSAVEASPLAVAV